MVIFRSYIKLPEGNFGFPVSEKKVKRRQEPFCFEHLDFNVF